MRGNRAYLVRCADCGTAMADRKLAAHRSKKHTLADQRNSPGAITHRGLVSRLPNTSK